MLRLMTGMALAYGLVACDSGVQLNPRGGTGGAAVGAQGGSGGCAPGQAILAGPVINARDLGGTKLADGSAVACGAVYRGPPLAFFDQPACDAFARLGIRTVIDLRMESERGGKPDSPCVAASANIVSTPLPIPYSVSPTDYKTDLNDPSMALVLKVLSDDTAYPAYLHCTWGRDRTGVISAVILLALGASRDAILQEYLLSQATVGAYPDSLVAVLDEIDSKGGIEAYLAGQGMSADGLATLRARGLAH